MLLKMIKYLAQAGPTHPKHGGGRTRAQLSKFPMHPILSFILHYAIVVPIIFLIHDTFFGCNAVSFEVTNDEEETMKRQMHISRFIFAYTLILFSTRCVSSFNAGRLRQHAVMYELTWLCNSTLLMGSIAFGGFDNGETTNWFLKRRPLVATACCIGVSIDQVLWYVDLVGYLALGKFPVGVMKYLTWQQTLWIDRLTCTHHLWTIPFFIYASNDQLGFNSFQLSVCIVTIKVCVSRWLTPHCIQIIKDDEDAKGAKFDPHRYRYLNINLCHELWRDITFRFLQISHDKPSGWVYLWRLLWRWHLFNYLVFEAILSPLSRLN